MNKLKKTLRKIHRIENSFNLIRIEMEELLKSHLPTGLEFEVFRQSGDGVCISYELQDSKKAPRNLLVEDLILAIEKKANLTLEDLEELTF